MRPGWPQALMVLPTQGLLMLVIGLPAIWVFWLSLQQSTFGEAPESSSGSPTTRSCWATPISGARSSTPSSSSTSSSMSSWRSGSAMALLFAAGVPLRRAADRDRAGALCGQRGIAVVMWRYMLEPEVGIVSQALAAVGLPELAWTTDRWAALTLVALLSIWLHLPFTFLILYAARLACRSELYEAPRIDGADALAAVLAHHRCRC